MGNCCSRTTVIFPQPKPVRFNTAFVPDGSCCCWGGDIPLDKIVICTKDGNKCPIKKVKSDEVANHGALQASLTAWSHVENWQVEGQDSTRELQKMREHIMKITAVWTCGKYMYFQFETFRGDAKLASLKDLREKEMNNRFAATAKTHSNNIQIALKVLHDCGYTPHGNLTVNNCVIMDDRAKFCGLENLTLLDPTTQEEKISLDMTSFGLLLLQLWVKPIYEGRIKKVIPTIGPNTRRATLQGQLARLCAVLGNLGNNRNVTIANWNNLDFTGLLIDGAPNNLVQQLPRMIFGGPMPTPEAVAAGGSLGVPTGSGGRYAPSGARSVGHAPCAPASASAPRGGGGRAPERGVDRDLVTAAASISLAAQAGLYQPSFSSLHRFQ